MTGSHPYKPAAPCAMSSSTCGTFDRVCGGKGEARARRRTALRLVSPVAYAAAEQVYEGNTWLMAVDLGVTAQAIDDYRQLLYDSGVCVQ